MAYFQQKTGGDNSYTRQFSPARDQDPETDWEEDEYDDGFDELTEEEPPEEFSEEERRAERERKYRVAAGFGNFGAIVVGTLVILALTAFLINMIRFISSDFSQNFSLWQTKF